MKLRLRNGMVITLMPYPKRKRPRKDDEFEPYLKRWMHLTVEEREGAGRKGRRPWCWRN